MIVCGAYRRADRVVFFKGACTMIWVRCLPRGFVFWIPARVVDALFGVVLE